jgi:hypothetical protein
MIQTAAFYYLDKKSDEFLRILYSFFICVLNPDFISDCNLHAEILHSIMTELTLDVEIT